MKNKRHFLCKFFAELTEFMFDLKYSNRISISILRENFINYNNYITPVLNSWHLTIILSLLA